MTRVGRVVTAAVLVLTGAAWTTSATADAGTTCHLGGPAGTASVLRLVLPHRTTGVAVRVTTPTTVGSRPSDVAGERSSWHMATGIAVVDERTKQVVAARFIQSGSSPRRIAVSGAGQDVRQDVAAPGAPFNHVGGEVPAVLPGGVYDVVAFGSDGDPAVPNPWWSGQLSVGARVACDAVPATTRLFDHDGSDFTGGTQVSGYGVGYAAGTRLALTTPKDMNVVGMIDAERQFAGSVRVSYRPPHGQGGAVTDDLESFSGGGGRYTFTADADGVFPVTLVSGVAYRLG